MPPSSHTFAPDIPTQRLLFQPGPSRQLPPPTLFRFEDEDDDDGDEQYEDDEGTHNADSDPRRPRLGGARPPGACDPCKQSKVRCVFPIPGAKCRRCEQHGHDCRVSGRKQKPRPPSHDELLARLRDKDDVILGLLVGGSTPHTAASSPGGTGSATSPASPLPPLPVWDRRTPKTEVERLVATWIQEARRRVGSAENDNDARPPLSAALLNDAPEPEPTPEILRTGIVTLQEVDVLFRIFFDKINMFFSVLDPVLHTPARVLRSSPFLFTTICAIASRHYPARPTLYPRLLRAAKHTAALALNAPKTVESCQAYLLLGVYHPPPRTFPEDRTFLFLGLAIRIASDLALHTSQPVPPSASEEEARAALNRERTWLNCFCTDRSISTQLGKPSAIPGVGVSCDLATWWGASRWNSPDDIHMCAYASLLKVVAGFHAGVVGRAGGSRHHLDLHSVQQYADEIARVNTEWAQRLAANSARRPHPATTWRDNLWPFLVSYAKLVVLSMGLQDAMRQGLRHDNPFSDQCVEAATDLLTHVTGTLARLGYLRYCVEAYFVFMGFAAAFLLKILRPKFAFMMRPGRAAHILALVQQLVDVLGSDATAIDSRHTPRLYARFLAGVLARERVRLARRSPGAESSRPAQPSPPFPPQPSLPPQPQSQPVHHPTTPTPQWMYTFFGAQQPPYVDMDVDPAAQGGDDMMLHSMAAITDPRFWEQGTMPGFAWAGGAAGAEVAAWSAGGGGGAGAGGAGWVPQETAGYVEGYTPPPAPIAGM